MNQVDERLLDITPPTFFLERALSLSDTTSLSPADQHILDLQREVDRSNLAVADACAARADAQLLAGRVAELEEQRDRAWGDVGGCDVEALKARLEIVERERDEALGLVRDAKKLFEAGVVGMFRIPV
jgi:hypothetical protein